MWEEGCGCFECAEFAWFVVVGGILAAVALTVTTGRVEVMDGCVG